MKSAVVVLAVVSSLLASTAATAAGDGTLPLSNGGTLPLANDGTLPLASDGTLPLLLVLGAVARPAAAIPVGVRLGLDVPRGARTFCDPRLCDPHASAAAGAGVPR